jgi:geranylgeranyl diphosphate synthase type II
MDAMVNTLASPWAEYAERLGPPIEAALGDYTDLSPGCPSRLREAMRYSLLAPGKRLRPMLALLAAEACGGDPLAAMPAACAVEMVHAYSLVHDDLPAMDDDDLRRGRPTCHKVFGEALAILAGDALLALAFEVLAGGVRPPEAAASCCAALAAAAGPCQLVGGQADDMAGQGENGKLCATAGLSSSVRDTVEQSNRGTCHQDTAGQASSGTRSLTTLESIHSRKTGAMIRVSLRLGAMVAGAAAGELAALEEYGRRLGLAFQITDDLLDVRSDEATAGKRVGKDAAKGKLTFPFLLGIERSAEYARQLIAEAIAALAPLGPAAAGLEVLARHVLERNR